ncbi:MAG: trypsin-like peptidase domain-containing protein [Elusimicrobiaceae bacterium]|nr:trypsin-like peptidase domain-containing protein [Elusimicrobiaceae bacterium]
MKKLSFFISIVFILLVYPLRAIEIDKSVLNDINLPAIVGKDNRQKVTEKTSAQEQAVVLITANGNTSKGTCSGAMVGPNIVLTAAHCIDKQMTIYAIGMPISYDLNDPHNASLMESISNSKTAITEWEEIADISGMDFETYLNMLLIKNIIREKIKDKNVSETEISWLHDETNKKVYFFTTAKDSWIADEYIENRHPSSIDDYALILLDYNLGNIIGWLKLKATPDEQLAGKNIVIIGRPGDKPAFTLWKSPGRIGKLNKNHIYYNADTVTGSSGSPIFDAENPNEIIGLHSFQKGPDRAKNGYPNGGLRITQEIIDAVKNIGKYTDKTDR